MTEPQTVRSEMAAYVAESFFTYEAMRDQRDEALVRSDELERERDQARRIAASLYEEVAHVRELHKPTDNGSRLPPYCVECSECASIKSLHFVEWPCPTAAAVYLTAEAVES